jgi:hypothetical protein
VAESETLLISCILDSTGQLHLLQPVGHLSDLVSQRLLEEALRLPYDLKIVGVCGRFLKEYSEFIKSFTVWEDRAISNYVYDANKLAQLPGRKYSKKRNLLAQASGQYRWICQPITAAKVDACFEVLKSIQVEERPRLEGMLGSELEALELTLRHFDEFGQQGLLIAIDDKPTAFSIFEAINPTTVAVHFERALRSYKGLYQVINWETAKVVAAQGFELINREEDMGDPGLRDAKTSYHPKEIIPAYQLDLKR